MIKNKTFLSIIPARSGSKGLPGKNIKEINHKPLLAYTIEACKKSEIFDEIFVSTDSLEYAKISKQYGADVPFLRPETLSRDESSSVDVIIHVLEEMKIRGKTYDYLVVLQPTSPMRTEKHIRESIDVLFQNEADSVVSVCKLAHPSFLNVSITEEGLLEVPFQNKKSVRRQEFRPEYRLNGAIYITSTNFFLQNKSMFGGNTYPYFMEPVHSIDIDDAFLFRVAELLLEYGW